MKRFFAAAILLTATNLSVKAADVTIGEITISNPFARASAGRAANGGGFMEISNTGNADRLISASAAVAESTELHTHIKDGTVMRMREVDLIDVPANGSVLLKPGGYHVMFMQLKDPLIEGDSFPLELSFEKAGKVTVEVVVSGVGAKMAPGMMHGDMKMKDGMTMPANDAPMKMQ